MSTRRPASPTSPKSPLRSVQPSSPNAQAGKSPPMPVQDSPSTRGRSAKRSQPSLQRSNSWSGDQRFETVCLRHVKNHLKYDTSSNSLVLTTGLTDSFYYDAFNWSEEQKSDIRNSGKMGFSDPVKDIELGSLRQDVRHARLTINQMEHDYNAAQDKLANRDRRIQSMQAQNDAIKARQRSVLDDVNVLVGFAKDKNVSSGLFLQTVTVLLGRWLKSRSLRSVIVSALLVILGVFVLLLASDYRMMMNVLQAQWGSTQLNPVMCEHRSAADEVAPFGLDFPSSVEYRYLKPEELSFPQDPKRACSPRIPLVLDFKNGFTMEGLHAWLKTNKTAARQLKVLSKHEGALLMRNLKGATDHLFEELMSDLDIQPADYTGSIGRRDKVSDTGNRRAVTKYPAPLVLMPHIEFGNQLTRPEFITFFADGLPEGAGETPLIEFASVWEQMSPELKLKFARGISFKTRLYPNAFQWIWGEYSSTWRQAFATDDPEEAIKKCQALPGVKSCSWGWDGALEYVVNFPALHFHEQKEVLSTTFGFWNSDLPLLSLSRFGSRVSFSDRLWAYFSIRFKYASMYTDPTPTRATFIDGSPLTIEDSLELTNLIWANSVIYPAKAGDTCIVNNEYIGHGRMNVIGPMSKRKIIAFIGGQYSLEKAVNFGLKFSPNKTPALRGVMRED